MHKALRNIYALHHDILFPSMHGWLHHHMQGMCILGVGTTANRVLPLNFSFELLVSKYFSV